MYQIAMDVMGSDLGVKPAMGAALNFLSQHKDVKIIFVGNREEIEDSLNHQTKIKSEQYEILATSQIIEMHDSFLDVRRKKDSSLVKTLELVKNKKVDGMLTAGNSAALLAGAHFILGELKNINKPGFMPTWPTIKLGTLTLFLDAGANIDNTAQDLLNYAIMATIYSQLILKIKNPKVGLLNVGTEKSKGRDSHKEAYKLLENHEDINFQGNVEAREMVSGTVDIIVTDGFSGNIALKSMEGALSNLMKMIKEAITDNLFRKIFAFCLKPAFKSVGNKFDYKNYAGAILLGTDGLVFKSHGSSDQQAWSSTINMVYNAIKANVLQKMKQQMEAE